MSSFSTIMFKIICFPMVSLGSRIPQLLKSDQNRFQNRFKDISWIFSGDIFERFQCHISRLNLCILDKYNKSMHHGKPVPLSTVSVTSTSHYYPTSNGSGEQLKIEKGKVSYCLSLVGFFIPVVH